MLSEYESSKDQKIQYPICQTLSQKIKQAISFKEEGNQYFKAKDYKKALSCYYKALLYVNGICDTNQYQQIFKELNKQKIHQNDQMQIQNIQIQVYNNISQTHINLQKWEKSVFNLNKAISIAQNNQILLPIKTYYRRCLSYMNLRDYEQCDKDLHIMQEQEPNNQDVQKLKKQINLFRKLEDKRNQKVYQNMFK